MLHYTARRPDAHASSTPRVANVSGTTWPNQTEVNTLCDFVKNTFQPQHWPTAFGHLVLTLTPCYDRSGNQWDEQDDPIRLPPENVGRFFGYVQTYLQTQITGLATAGKDEEKQRQFEATRAALEKGPPAKGVILFDGKPPQVHQARAVAIPYYPFLPGAVPPLQPIDFDPDGDCTKSMQTAAWECVARRKDVGWSELIKTVLGGPVGFLSLVLVWMGVFFYVSFALGGGGWLYGLNLFLLPFPRAFLLWGFVAACAGLVVGLLGSLLWSETRSVLPLKQKQAETPDNFYFLVFVEDTNETPYYGELSGISFGLTFFCAFVGAVVKWMQRPPAWAKRLVELMKAGRLVACAGLKENTGENLQYVEVIPKLNAIQTDSVFPLLNTGELIARWQFKRARVKEKVFQAKEKTRGIRVFCFDTLEQMISRLLTPYQWHRYALRFLIMLLLLLAFTFDQTPPPKSDLDVLAKKEKYPKQRIYKAGMIIIPDMQPDEQVTLEIPVYPLILWPFKLKVDSEKKTLFEGEEYHCVIERRVWSLKKAQVDFHMRKESDVLVTVIVQDLLKRRSQQNLRFVLGESAPP